MTEERDKEEIEFLEEVKNKAEEVIDLLGELPYFEKVLVLEIAKDIERIGWMGDVAKEYNKGEEK